MMMKLEVYSLGVATVAVAINVKVFGTLFTRVGRQRCAMQICFVETPVGKQA